MLNQTRDDRGRYEQDTEDMRNRSVVASIIHEELDKFFKSASDRLNALTTEDIDEETALAVAESKKDIRNAVAMRFGNPIASSFISTTRSPSSWNGFYKDNWAVVAEEWKLEHPEEGKSFHWGINSRIESGGSECKAVCKMAVT
jgi:hypothetical protein